VVLTLVTPERFLRFAVLVAVEGDSGVLQAANTRRRVPLAALGPLWRGDFEVIWQPPQDYAGPVSKGDRGPMVNWLARTFAAMDGQTRPLARDEFNDALEARVRLFQRRFKLNDDGVGGIKTLLKLHSVSGEGTTLAAATTDVARLGER
jgi:general secretion pathway protein A